jgi:hypothetical protein
MSETFQGSQASTNHPLDKRSPAKPGQIDCAHGNPLKVFGTFLKLGLTAFGGPIAHLGCSVHCRSGAIFGKTLVRRQRCEEQTPQL